jgi:hypothetical protein
VRTEKAAKSAAQRDLFPDASASLIDSLRKELRALVDLLK